MLDSVSTLVWLWGTRDHTARLRCSTATEAQPGIPMRCCFVCLILNQGLLLWNSIPEKSADQKLLFVLSSFYLLHNYLSDKETHRQLCKNKERGRKIEKGRKWACKLSGRGLIVSPVTPKTHRVPKAKAISPHGDQSHKVSLSQWTQGAREK